jgi:hypothetical protein
MRFSDIISEAYDFVFETPADEIIKTLQHLNIDNYNQINNKRVIVTVPRAERKSTLDTLLTRLPNAVYNKNMSGSSLGGINYAGGNILIKPSGSSGEKSAGLSNEKHLVDTINRFVSEIGPINVIFVGDNGKSITAKNVTQAISAGADVANRKKSDVNLMSGNRLIPISLKKSNAEYWESADTLWGNKADQLINQLVSQKRIKLTPIGKTRNDGAEFVKISPEVAIPASLEDTLAVVFGSDILTGQGGVVKQTFDDEHYKLDGNNLTITADLVITSAEDIPEKNKVYWLIRNDSTRTRPNHKYPGLRVIASYASRINKNTLIVK